MPVPTNESRQRQEKLIRQLGGDPVASRAVHNLVTYLNIETAEELWAYYEKTGPVAFAYEILDLRGVGVTSAQRITDLVESLEPVI